jgi:hypothetical protein
MNLPALPNRQNCSHQHHNASNAVHTSAFPAGFFQAAEVASILERLSFHPVAAKMCRRNRENVAPVSWAALIRAR